MESPKPFDETRDSAQTIYTYMLLNFRNGMPALSDDDLGYMQYPGPKLTSTLCTHSASDIHVQHIIMWTLSTYMI